jgi:hypothetical protein
LAIGILLDAIAHQTAASLYLAAFASDVLVSRLDPDTQEAFSELGEQLAELARFAAQLVFGALLTPPPGFGPKGFAPVPSGVGSPGVPAGHHCGRHLRRGGTRLAMGTSDSSSMAWRGSFPPSSMQEMEAQ